MPVSAIDLVKKLMTKAGVTFDGELTGDIPDEVATALDNGLLTIAAATNNHPAIKKVYFAQAYNGLDAELNDLITEFGISDEVKAEIEKAGGSTKRAVALARKIKELSEKAEPADKTKTVQLQAEINSLNQKLAAEIAKQTEIKSQYDKQIKDIQVKTKLGAMLGSYKTVYDDLPAEAKEAAINSLISTSLQGSDAEFTFDEKGQLAIIKKDGTNLFGENHTLITPQAFIDKTLSKILKVSTPAQNGGNISNLPAAPVNGAQNGKNPALEAAIAESMQQYEAATKQAVAI
jgi:hypothetical protein